MKLTSDDLIYGTAWKEDLTESCVLTALRLGYRAIDSANQRKHYHEEAVGEAIAKAKSSLGLSREELFLQSKFTYAGSQDHRKPYDERHPIKDQVNESFNDSLKKLKTEYLDSYLLHGPSSGDGISSVDFDAWGEMEELCRGGRVKAIGIANVSRDQLSQLYEHAEVKPAFVQNRCLAQTRWDREVRTYCRENGIQYQGFSLLTNNWKYIGGKVLRPETRNIPQLVFAGDGALTEDLQPVTAAIVMDTGETIQRVIFRFAQQIGITPILGSRSEAHMKMNLNLAAFRLTDEQVTALENIAFDGSGLAKSETT